MNASEFTAIVHETKDVVLRAVQKHLAAQFYEAIDDVVQETYLRAYKSLAAGKFEGRSTLDSWLYRIAANESKRMNGKLLQEQKKIQKLSRSTTAYSPAIDCEELSLMPVIEMLPDKYKDVVKLKAQGNNEWEIATKLNIPKGTVKSRLSRGKDLLLRLLQEEL